MFPIRFQEKAISTPYGCLREFNAFIVILEEHLSCITIGILRYKGLAQKVSKDLGGSFAEISFWLRDFK
jgi:hypothetical protein